MSARAYTFGELLDDVIRAESIIPLNQPEHDRILAKDGAFAASLFLANAMALGARPCLREQPGGEEIELACDELENGQGVTANNLRRVRAKVCRLHQLPPSEVDRLDISQVAKLLSGGQGEKTGAEAPGAAVPTPEPKNTGPSHPFTYPIAFEVVDRLRKQFVEAVARYEPIGYAMIGTSAPWPTPEPILEAFGKNGRLCVQRGASEQTTPPAHLFFGPRDAMDRYRELASDAARQLPLNRPPQGEFDLWTFNLCWLAWQPNSFTYRAPYQLVRAYSDGAILSVEGEADSAWPGMEALERSRGVSGHWAEAWGWRLVDVWVSSVEVLTCWSGERASPPESISSSVSVKQSKGKRIDEKMLAVLQKNPEALNWSAREWATKLDCSKSTIGESTTWTVTIRTARACEQAERITRQKRKEGQPDEDE